MSIDIADLDKGAVLAALWNNAAMPPDHSSANPRTRPMTEDEGGFAFMAALTSGGGFDYYEDRLLKVDLSGDSIDPWDYDRDNGTGLAARVIAHLRKTGSVDRLPS